MPNSLQRRDSKRSSPSNAVRRMLLSIIAICAALQTYAEPTGSALDDVLTNDGGYFTTNFGQPVFSENASLTVGPRGAMPVTV